MSDRPWSGWSCVGIDDMGRPSETCELCGTAVVRYVHTMTHPRWGENLRVGCVCAGHLEGNSEAAKRRDAVVVSVDRRLKRWLKKSWLVSRKGNPWLKLENRTLSVFEQRDAWAFCVNNKGGNTFEGNFATQAAAKEAAIKHLASQLAREEAGVEVRLPQCQNAVKFFKTVRDGATARTNGNNLSKPAEDWWRALLPSR
jgi:hypothetical protein